jgi:hypothetical protein
MLSKNALGPSEQATAIVAGPSGDLVIVGTRFENGSQAASWHSATGQTWTRNPAPGGTDSIEMLDAVWLTDRFVAVGDSGASEGEDPAAWVSFDGEHWAPAADVPGANANRAVILQSVTVAGRGVVAVGPSPEGTAGVWTSTDGTSWFRTPNVGGLDSPDDLKGTYPINDIAAAAGGLIGVGNYVSRPWILGGERSAAIWLSPASAPASPTHTPGCPARTGLTAVEVLTPNPADLIACFGRQSVTFEALLAPIQADEGLPLRTWLSPDGPWCLLPTAKADTCLGDFVSVIVYRDPAKVSGRAFPSTGSGLWLRVTGHFDDPRAQECTQETIFAESVAAAVEACRERFVITDLAAA